MDKNNIIYGVRALSKYLKCSQKTATKLIRLKIFPYHTVKYYITEDKYRDIGQIVFYKTEVMKGIVNNIK